jgi:phospholipid/cholesterol/gamma-HCH transport system substrate-binding protein
METRANYALVGGFVLSSIAGILVFIVWISNISSRLNYTPYNIYFTGSVTGLQEGSFVRYRGVPVGTVQSIAIDPEKADQVRVSIRIDQSVPIREDAFASIEVQGLTGNSYIQINGGTPNSRFLLPAPGQSVAVIPSKSSRLEEVADTLPSMIQQINRMAADIRDVLSEENRQNFSGILKDLHAITQSLKPEGDKTPSLGDVLSEIKLTLGEIRKSSENLTHLLQDNRQGVKDFIATGLPEFKKFLVEGREALSAVKRVGESLERSPSRFFYNDTKQGVKIR